MDQSSMGIQKIFYCYMYTFIWIPHSSHIGIHVLQNVTDVYMYIGLFEPNGSATCVPNQLGSQLVIKPV